MTGDDGLAALLYQHQMFDGLNFDHCECGERIDTEWEDMAAHQGAVIRAAGWVKGCEEEWGVMVSDPAFVDHGRLITHCGDSRQRAEDFATLRNGVAPVRRIVTDWEPAETGDHE